MNKNKNFRLRKWIVILMLSTSVNGLLYAEQNPMTSVWTRYANNCEETYLFSAFSDIFISTSSTGKKILGTYTQEYMKNFNRTKLSLKVIGDNGIIDCFNDKYDLDGRTLILYSVFNTRSNMLQLSKTKTGNFFGFFVRTNQLTPIVASVIFRTTFNTLLAESKAKNEKLRRQQITTSTQSTQNHEATMEVIKNMAQSDHYDSSTGEYKGSW